jgi:hypothetical protein
MTPTLQLVKGKICKLQNDLACLHGRPAARCFGKHCEFRIVGRRAKDKLMALGLGSK